MVNKSLLAGLAALVALAVLLTHQTKKKDEF